MSMTLSEIYDRLNTMQSAGGPVFDVRQEVMDLTRIVSDMHAQQGDLLRRLESLERRDRPID